MDKREHRERGRMEDLLFPAFNPVEMIHKIKPSGSGLGFATAFHLVFNFQRPVKELA